MLDLRETVARIVLDHSECAEVFQRNRIDFCCRGNVSLAEAATAQGLDPDALKGELQKAIAARRGDDARDFRAMSTAGLCGHIVATHHEYLRKSIPFLLPLSAKVRRVHGDHDPRLLELDDVVQALAAALIPHLDQEEETLFPALVAKKPDAAIIGKELASMHADHLAVGDLLHRMRKVSADFTTPEWACNSYRTLFAELTRLEGDVLRHVHLENHVLMPRFAQ